MTEDTAYAATELKRLLKGVRRIKMIVTHVSSSGMSRTITPLVATKRGEIVDITHWVLELGIGDKPRGRRHGVEMGGCGMDMGEAIAYELGRRLYNDGYRYTT